MVEMGFSISDHRSPVIQYTHTHTHIRLPPAQNHSVDWVVSTYAFRIYIAVDDVVGDNVERQHYNEISKRRMERIVCSAKEHR